MLQLQAWRGLTSVWPSAVVKSKENHESEPGPGPGPRPFPL